MGALDKFTGEGPRAGNGVHQGAPAIRFRRAARSPLQPAAAVLDDALDGNGCVISFSGPAGIGKSRVVREAARLARRRGVEVLARYMRVAHRWDRIPCDRRAPARSIRIDDLRRRHARTRVRPHASRPQ
jgi:hypothetical protein